MLNAKKFGLDVGITFLASIANLIISFPISIILGRYLGADDLGLYRIVFTLYGITMLFAGAGISVAMVKYVAEFQDNKFKIIQMISSSVFISTILGLIALLLFFFFSSTLGHIFNMAELPALLRVISIAFPFSISGATLLGILNGFRRMKERAYIIVLQSTLQLAVTLLMFYFGYGVIGFVIGIVISSMGSCMVSAWILKNYFKIMPISQLINHFKLLLSFGSRTVFANSMNMINYQADTLLVGYFLTQTDVGYYSVAIIFSKLLLLIPNSIQTVTYPTMSKYYGKKQIESVKQLVRTTMKYTACISIITGTFMFIYAKPLITLAYGDSFIESASPFHILIIGTMISSVVKSVNSLFASADRVDLFAKIPTISAIVNITLNLLLIPIYGIVGAAIATTISSILYVGVMIYYMRQLLEIAFNITWYIKAGFLITVLFLINDILIDYITVYISGIITIIFGIGVIWKYLLISQERKYFQNVFISLKK